jgi:hypothetical protein
MLGVSALRPVACFPHFRNTPWHDGGQTGTAKKELGETWHAGNIARQDEGACEEACCEVMRRR